MPSINDQSITCFVLGNVDDGFMVKMYQPSGTPLEHALDLHRAVTLQRQLSDAIAQMVKPTAPTAPEKYFQK